MCLGAVRNQNMCWVPEADLSDESGPPNKGARSQTQAF